MYRLPSVRFLLKVRDGGVCTTQLPSQQLRGEVGFCGEWATYRRHLATGFVEGAPSPSPGQPGYVTLSEAGRRALVEAGYSLTPTRAK